MDYILNQSALPENAKRFKSRLTFKAISEIFKNTVKQFLRKHKVNKENLVRIKSDFAQTV